MLNYIGWLIAGAIAGGAASVLVRPDGRMGVLLNVLTGILGAFAAGIVLLPLRGSETVSPDTLSVTSMLVALAGAVSLLGFMNLIRRKPRRAVRRAEMRWEDDGGATGFERPAAVTEPPHAAEAGENHPASASPHTAGEDLNPEYRAVVTAHFPDRESGLRAQHELAAMGQPPADQQVQWFDAKPPAAPLPGSKIQPLPEVTTALIVQLADQARGEEIVRLCQAAGATLATFYPARSVVGAARAI